MVKNQDLIFGVNPVVEKLKASSEDLVEILVSEVSDRGALRDISRNAARLGIRLTRVDPKVLDQLSGGQRHQGVVARVTAFRYLPFVEVLERIAAPTVTERILVLDGLTDSRNFGALLRTAEAAGVRYIVIPKNRSVEVTALTVKASAGAVHHVNISKVTNLRRALSELKKHSYWVVGLDAGSKESIYERSYPARLAIVVGSEGLGIRPINLRECDFAVSIPMAGKVRSLNVSVAGAVFLYELLRQSRRVGGTERVETRRNGSA
ncbi:MAG TPA: 23S rRNA (guanosine(2251)-2'-O)-methyltransferase RlmB [Candidatus Binatia bacterium]|jgi:23S rRNA (guanosine2251-2'-O)-methyltransferase